MSGDSINFIFQLRLNFDFPNGPSGFAYCADLNFTSREILNAKSLKHMFLFCRLIRSNLPIKSDKNTIRRHIWSFSIKSAIADVRKIHPINSFSLPISREMNFLLIRERWVGGRVRSVLGAVTASPSTDLSNDRWVCDSFSEFFICFRQFPWALVLKQERGAAGNWLGMLTGTWTTPVKGKTYENYFLFVRYRKKWNFL